METPFAQPLYLLAKPAGATCNMACSYCYYTEKKSLTPDGQPRVMSDDTLERFIRLYIESQTGGTAVFNWHGGEAMMRPLSFYRRVVELQQRYAGGCRIENCIQTNGTLLTDEWCVFLRRNGWLVGLSVDGPEEFHDRYRRMRAGSGPSFRRVMLAIRMLQRHAVEWNAMAVVNDFNSGHPEEFYDFFRNIGCRFIQFTPIVERVRADGRLAAVGDSGTLAPFSVSPRRWGEFLCRLFDHWIGHDDVGRIFVQIFDATLANWVGATPSVCSMARECGHAGAIEFNGDVYSCDHFVFPEYYLGNIRDKSLVEMMWSERQLAFGAAKCTSLPPECRRCEYLFACNGECPRNRFALDSDGNPGLNYLCEGYRMFFEHVRPAMDVMAAALRERRSPADAIREFRGHSPVV